MKILLINPPNINYARISTGWDFEIGNIGFFPPYGLISLAAYIRKYRDNYEIRVLDCVAENIDYDKLGKYIKEFHPDVAGIGAFTYTFYDVLKTSRLVKDILPGSHVCLGGPHVSLFPEETLCHTEIDSLVLGDGEVPFLNLLDHLGEGKPINNIESVIGKVHEFSQTDKLRISYMEDLDSLPFPAYDFIDGSLYRGTFGKGGKMACICGSRGCPYSCTFCQVLTKKYRMHSVGYMVDMIKQFYDQGYREFYFFDDLFNVTSQRVIDIANAMLYNKLKINWVFRGRADKIDEEMIKVASKAGCSHILLGVEDYNDEGLKKIKKKVTMAQVKKAIELAHKYGIEISTNWIIGLPNHKDVDDIKKLVKTSIDIGSDYSQYGILQLLPGCDMFEEAISEGILHRNKWSEFVKNPVPNYQIEPYDKYFSINELSKLYKYCHNLFYKRCSYVLKRLKKLSNINEFKRLIRPAMRILFG